MLTATYNFMATYIFIIVLFICLFTCVVGFEGIKSFIVEPVSAIAMRIE